MLVIYICSNAKQAFVALNIQQLYFSKDTKFKRYTAHTIQFYQAHVLNKLHAEIAKFGGRSKGKTCIYCPFGHVPFLAVPFHFSGASTAYVANSCGELANARQHEML